MVIYPTLFFVLTFLKWGSDFFDKLIFCSICATWFIIMAYGLFFYSTIISAFQIGLSMTGISMYLNEERAKRKISFPLDFFLLQFSVTIIGLILIILKTSFF